MNKEIGFDVKYTARLGNEGELVDVWIFQRTGMNEPFRIYNRDEAIGFARAALTINAGLDFSDSYWEARRIISSSELESGVMSKRT